MAVQTPAPAQLRIDQRPVDPRGPRFAAGVTTVVLAIILVLGLDSVWSAVLLAFQLLVFAAGAILGLPYQPYGAVYRKFVSRLLPKPRTLEDPRPPRFAQAVGAVFLVIGAAGWVLDLAPVFYIAVGMATAATFLNFAFNFCLGCEMYLWLHRSGVKPAV